MAYNSTIKQKWGICIDCKDEELKPLTAGRCPYHYKKHRGEISSSKQKLQTDIRKLIVKDNEIDMSYWYTDKIRIIRSNPYCTECGAFIPDKKMVNDELVSTNKFYKAAAAHIFPKSLFESIAVHPLNYVIAAAGCGCHNKTHTIESFSKMKIFPIAVQRFRIFEPQITEQHKYLTLFKEAANAYIL